MKNVLLVLILSCVGCTQRVNITNTRVFNQSMNQFNQLEAMRTPGQVDMAALARKMIGPIPTTQLEFQRYKKLQSVWGKYLMP